MRYVAVGCCSLRAYSEIDPRGRDGWQEAGRRWFGSQREAVTAARGLSLAEEERPAKVSLPGAHVVSGLCSLLRTCCESGWGDQ